MTLGVILYYYILYYTIIIYYTILYNIILILFLPSFRSIIYSSSSQYSSSQHLIHSILVGTYIYLFIFNHSFPSSDLFFLLLFQYSSSDLISSSIPFPSNHLIYSQSSVLSSHSLIHSILVGTYIYLFIFSSSSSPTIWPRTNYRRDVSSGVVLFVWCSVRF